MQNNPSTMARLLITVAIERVAGLPSVADCPPSPSDRPRQGGETPHVRPGGMPSPDEASTGGGSAARPPPSGRRAAAIRLRRTAVRRLTPPSNTRPPAPTGPDGPADRTPSDGQGSGAAFREAGLPRGQAGWESPLDAGREVGRGLLPERIGKETLLPGRPRRGNEQQQSEHGEFPRHPCLHGDHPSFRPFTRLPAAPLARFQNRARPAVLQSRPRIGPAAPLGRRRCARHEFRHAHAKIVVQHGTSPRDQPPVDADVHGSPASLSAARRPFRNRSTSSDTSWCGRVRSSGPARRR